jgi:hypothetical protein
MAALGLTDLTRHPTNGMILEANNLTILNWFLLRLGPMNEKRLVQVLMCSQVRTLCYFSLYVADSDWTRSREACSHLLCATD